MGRVRRLYTSVENVNTEPPWVPPSAPILFYPEHRSRTHGAVAEVVYMWLPQRSALSVPMLRYRFPTGESGADVYDRTRQWWDSMMDSSLVKSGLFASRLCPPFWLLWQFAMVCSPAVSGHLMEQSGASSIIVVTHGLTMRLILMQLFHWSPNTFHTVWQLHLHSRPFVHLPKFVCLPACWSSKSLNRSTCLAKESRQLCDVCSAEEHVELSSLSIFR